MKNRRGSVLWRCTWYVTQPGSFRDSSVSLDSTPATSASCPVFAIHVTASTTIFHLLAKISFLHGQRLQFRRKFVNEHRLLASRPGGNHADADPTLFLKKVQIVASRLGKSLQFDDPLS